MANTKRSTNKAFRIHPALIALSIITVLLILVAVVLYPAARDYYFALRDNQLLSEEYQAVVERNVEIEKQIVEMQTPEGIADKAREELGWVLKGEEAVNITGLESEGSSLLLPPTVEPGSILPEDNWWTQTLDEFFGYKLPAPADAYKDNAIPGL